VEPVPKTFILESISVCHFDVLQKNYNQGLTEDGVDKCQNAAQF
jgi:hypothetical protein